MNLLDILNTGTNLISLVAIALSVFVFFTDRFRRWLFFGYKPTAIVAVVDSKSDAVLIIKRNFANKVDQSYPWYFPQGGIYSVDLNETVNNILKNELGLDPTMYVFEKTVVLGIKKIRKRKIHRKHQFGSFSLFTSFKGKGYVVCVVDANLNTLTKKIKLGYGLDGFKKVSFNQAIKMVDPHKAQMLRKVSRQILG